MEKNTYRNILITGVVGDTIECLIQQPIYALKNLKQIGLKAKKFSHLYRGLLGNIATQSTLVVSQISAYKYLTEKVSHPTLQYKLAVASGIGFLSGFLFSPFEQWSIKKQQQRNFWKDRYYFRGGRWMGLREACYATGLLTLVPYISNQTEIMFNYRNEILSSVIAGSVAGVLSHPFDTLKSNVQSQYTNNYEKIGYNLFNTTLYRGLWPRIFRIITSYYILHYCNSFMLDWGQSPSF